MKNLLHGNTLRFKRTGCIILSSLILISAYHLLFKPKSLLERIQNDPKFEQCAHDAIAADSYVPIAVCERVSVLQDEEVDTIIYDGTDEIMLSAPKRSLAWNKRTELLSRAESQSHQAPFTIMGFAADPIIGHYYKVIFCDPVSCIGAHY